jgi:dTDP-4-amino-4,6-dideoxygalactose transaminase
MINVTKTYLPPFHEYAAILKRAWDKGWLTNNGELVQELEAKLKAYLGVENLLYCSNGTIVLQMAIKALGLTKEIITTPFSYVATTNAILWEGCTPVFVDIEPETFTLDPEKIEAAITENTQAILATHVYGFPCKIEAIQAIADKYGLKVIYDGAHAFGVKYQGQSLFNYGDITTCSFHATKVFHTGEGGALFTTQNALLEKMQKSRAFGHFGDEYFQVGINGKNSEMHAALGLAIMPYFEKLIEKRKAIFSQYFRYLPSELIYKGFKKMPEGFNYGYFPIICPSYEILIQMKNAFAKEQIFPRRYFYPSLNNLPFLKCYKPMPISDELSKRVLCLPLEYDLEDEMVLKICGSIQKAVIC